MGAESAAAHPERGAVLVTGASSGIGRHLAETLGAAGVRTWATARRAEDLEALEALPGVVPLELDVRFPEQVEAAAARVRADEAPLHGLVHNAGVGPLGPLPSFDDEDLRDLFEVNLFGPHRLTRALLGELVASAGRLVHVGSMGGQITARFHGAYCMTKHALEAANESLAEELEPHGVGVSIVQPGGVVSEIGAKAQAGTVRRLMTAPPPFEEEARALLAALEAPPPEPDPDAPESATNRKPSHPSLVTEAVLDALYSELPRRRYLVGTRWEGDRVVRGLLARLLDANECASLRYTREELIAFLDAELVRRSRPNGDR